MRGPLDAGQRQDGLAPCRFGFFAFASIMRFRVEKELGCHFIDVPSQLDWKPRAELSSLSFGGDAANARSSQWRESRATADDLPGCRSISTPAPENCAREYTMPTSICCTRQLVVFLDLVAAGERERRGRSREITGSLDVVDAELPIFAKRRA